MIFSYNTGISSDDAPETTLNLEQAVIVWGKLKKFLAYRNGPQGRMFMQWQPVLKNREGFMRMNYGKFLKFYSIKEPPNEN